LQSIHCDEVIVVSGTADQISSVFKAINLPHKVIEPDALAGIELLPSYTVYMNCHPSGYSEAAQKNIKNFVKSGGQLITTDYVLNTLLQQMFPEYVRYDGASTVDKTVNIECSVDTDEVLKAFKGESIWKLAGGSHPITIVDKEKVTVLISSAQLAAEYSGNGAVLIKFQYEQGTVYHMISHLHINCGNKSGSNSNNSNPIGSEYAKMKGASEEVVERMQNMEKESKGYNYEDMQSATVTTEWAYRSVMGQKKKFSS